MTNTTDEHPLPTPTETQRCRRRRRIKRLLVVGLVTGAAIGFMLPASAHGPRGAQTPKQIRAKMDAAADFAIEFLDGTERQRDALNPILDGLANDMANFRNEGRALRKSFMDAMLADELDEGAIEKIRLEAIKLADTASKSMLDDLRQFHAVMTPEQRAKLRRMAKKAERRWKRR